MISLGNTPLGVETRKEGYVRGTESGKRKERIRIMGIDVFGIGAVGDLFKTVLEKFAPDANAKLALQQAHDAELSAAAQQAAGIEAGKYTADIDLLKKQLDVNLAEASNANLFISGARPFAMWSLTVVVQVLAVAFFVAVVFKHDVTAFLEVFFTLVSLLCTLLGVHTIERHRGVAPEQPDGPNVPRAVSVAESLVLPAVQKIEGKFLRA